MMKQLAIFLLLLSVSGSCYAQKITAQIVGGAGFSSCKAYEDSKKYDGTNVFISWAQGFFSGLNMANHRANKPTIPLPDADMFREYLDIYCGGSPDGQILTGLALLHSQLKKHVEESD